MSYVQPASGLPDPDYQAEFYQGVAAKRLLAWVVDTLLVLLISVLILPFTLFVGLFFFAFLFMGVNLAYRVISIARNSATPGMRLMAIELRGADGARLDTPTATFHTLIYMCLMTIFPLQIVSAILMAVSARGQGLQDMALGTAAINRPSRH
ncbi:MAG: RDD family protein [Pseudomonadota bacterium]